MANVSRIVQLDSTLESGLEDVVNDTSGTASLIMQGLTLLGVIGPYIKAIYERLRKTEDRTSQQSMRIRTLESRALNV